MKKPLFLFVTFIFILVSCNTKDTKEDEVIKDSTTVLKPDTALAITDVHYFWVADLQREGLVMKRHRPISADSLTISQVINMLNATFTDVSLQSSKLSHDTLFVRIPNSEYLTQRMGSSGAEAYLAEATYNLTEISGVDFVNFNFKEGDHAGPGTYSRTSFVK